RALATETAQVQAALAVDEAFVDFIRYAHFLGPDQSESRYGAIVLSRNEAPRWVALGVAEPIERAITLYGKSVRGQTDEATVHRNLRDLWKLAWAPVAQALSAETRRLILCLDAELSLVSFATLLGPDDRFLAEQWPLRYV